MVVKYESMQNGRLDTKKVKERKRVCDAYFLPLYLSLNLKKLIQFLYVRNQIK